MAMAIDNSIKSTLIHSLTSKTECFCFKVGKWECYVGCEAYRRTVAYGVTLWDDIWHKKFLNCGSTSVHSMLCLLMMEEMVHTYTLPNFAGCEFRKLIVKTHCNLMLAICLGMHE